MSAAVEPAAAAVEAADALRFTSTEDAAEDGSLPLNLDITTEELSLAGLEKEIEAYADSEVLRAILDQGATERRATVRACPVRRGLMRNPAP
jgi:hypothetical protein